MLTPTMVNFLRERSYHLLHIYSGCWIFVDPSFTLDAVSPLDNTGLVIYYGFCFLRVYRPNLSQIRLEKSDFVRQIICIWKNSFSIITLEKERRDRGNGCF